MAAAIVGHANAAAIWAAMSDAVDALSVMQDTTFFTLAGGLLDDGRFWPAKDAYCIDPLNLSCQPLSPISDMAISGLNPHPE